MTHRESSSDHVAGGLMGLLVGDALGVPYEFRPSHEMPPRQQIEFTPPQGFQPSHLVPPGTFSDDGAHALCLLASLLERNGLDLDDLGRRLVRWRDEGYMAVDARVFDCGFQTSRALARIRDGEAAINAGISDEYGNGNGSLMRALPLALWHAGDDDALAHAACLQSRVTHAHPRSQACCALYVLWARRTMERHRHPWETAVATLRALWPEDSPLRGELEVHVRPDDFSPGRGSGYVVDCLRSARWALREPSYEAVVKAAISLGEDTDTTACVAGGIAGLRDGFSAIPTRWREGLRGRELFAPLLEQLVARVRGEGT